MFRANLEPAPTGNFNFHYLAFLICGQQKRDDFKRTFRGG